MEPKVKEIGKLFVVDPNPPGGKGLEQIPPEDLFIYVKFTATPRSRQIFEGTNSNGQPEVYNSGVSDEINFISTEIRYNSDGKLEPETQKTFATTNWTGIGGESSSGGVLEGFGIKSIDIKYNASLVPVVDITFTDVRGAALFDTIKENDRQSAYSIFFKMPYPIFTLSVKGYFGNTVDYCLHMVNWNSNFDGSTGNFDITANFLGFQQAFLNDMNIGNIIANVNTPEGRQELDRLQWTYKDGGEEITIKEDVRKIDDFFLKISKLQIEAEVLKTNNEGFGELKDLNGQLSLLREIQGFIGGTIVKKTTNTQNDSEESYLNKKNTELEYESSRIDDDNLIKNTNYLSIRDYLVINSINVSAYKTYINTLTDIINKYTKFIGSSKIKSNKDSNTALTNSFYKVLDNNSYLHYVVEATKKNNNIDPVNLSEILSEFGKIDSPLSLTKNYDKKDNNTTFNIVNYKKELDEDKIYKIDKGLNPDTKVFVVDFRRQRALLENLISKVKEDVKKKKILVTEEINKDLTDNFKTNNGFKPTIENCFRILANNTQALTSTIYEITKKATGVPFSSRKDVLGDRNTDVPKSIKTSVAWPSVYQSNDGGGETEIYLGEISGTKGTFPERDYVDKIYNAFVAKQKSIANITKASSTANGFDTDNWFPINPLDYNINPYSEFNISGDKKSFYNILANRIILRSALLKNYSVFDSNTGFDKFTDYAEIDGINANLTIFNPDVRNFLETELVNENELYNFLKQTTFFKDYVIDINNELIIANGQKIGNIKIGGLEDNSIEYIDFDNDKMIDNSKSLPSEITEEYSKYGNLISETNTKIVKEEKVKTFLTQKYNWNSLNTNISYNVWDEAVSKKLYNTNNKDQTILKISNLLDVDITATTSDNKGKYLNKTNFDKFPKNEATYSDFMTDSDLYNSQPNKYAKGLLLLSTIPFKIFKEAVLDDVFGGKYNGARILKLPKYYIFLIGGYLWRNSNDNLIFNSNNSDFYTPKNQYLTRIGYLSTTDKKGKIFNIEPELLNLPNQTKELLIKKFKNWVDFQGVGDSGSGRFESNMNLYHSETKDGDENSVASTYLKGELSDETKMIIFAPKIFDVSAPLTEFLTITESDVKSYIKSFRSSFTKTNQKNINGESNNENEDEDENFKIKLSIYNYFKNINDKWVSDTEKSFSVCGDGSTNSDKNLIDYFKFIDRGWNPIGNKAVFNLNSFLNLGHNFKTSVYFFMSKILRDSNFLFQILPTYVNFQKAEEVAKIFTPVTTLENNSSSGPLYACIYIGGASKVLDIQERNYGYTNDGFSFPDPNSENPEDVPPDYIQEQFEELTKNSQVAFRVAFGAQNQSIFKNVSLNQQEHKETGEYFKALSDLVDKRGGTQKTYQGTDLFKLFNTRSYTCKVDALGCMNIQPLMYFDLQNVPFFKGAYLITSVNHSITPNNMTTNFQGVRQSKFIAPPPSEITADLKLNLNESTDTSGILEFSNLNSDRNKFVIGVEDPEKPFNFGKFNLVNFKRLGIPDSVNTKINRDSFSLLCNTNGIKTNEQVCMLMGNILTTSDNMTNTSKVFDEKAITSDTDSHNTFDVEYQKITDGTIYSGKTMYYGVNPPPPSSPFYDIYKDTLKNTSSAVTPTFTSSTFNENTISIAFDNYTESKYGNDFPGDAWLFRPRGYLYITGRKEYFESSLGKSYFTIPWLSSQKPKDAFAIAVDVWKNKKLPGEKGSKEVETAFEICEKGDGGANIYTRTLNIVGNENDISKAFNKFENVLLVFGLKDEFQLD